MRISDWSSDVCSSDLQWPFFSSRRQRVCPCAARTFHICQPENASWSDVSADRGRCFGCRQCRHPDFRNARNVRPWDACSGNGDYNSARPDPSQMPEPDLRRSEENTAELQSLMRITYAGFGWKI